MHFETSHSVKHTNIWSDRWGILISAVPKAQSFYKDKIYYKKKKLKKAALKSVHLGKGKPRLSLSLSLL